MMRTALNRIGGAHSETSVMIGDRMDTDVKSGLEAGMRSILVLSGSTRAEDLASYPYRPTEVLDGIADIVPLVEEMSLPRRSSSARTDAVTGMVAEVAAPRLRAGTRRRRQASP